jgi:hypothetical protein
VVMSEAQCDSKMNEILFPHRYIIGYTYDSD